MVDLTEAIPPVLLNMKEWLVAMQDLWQTVLQYRNQTADGTANDGPGTNGSSFLLPLMAILLVFWPVLFSLIMFFVTAGTWLFWLATGMLLGILQMCFAMYHYSMIAFDIFVLSLLKTYVVLRNLFLYHCVDRAYWTATVAAPEENSSAGRKMAGQLPEASSRSRRRYWRQCLEQAGNYENFLKIRIRNKDESSMIFNKTKTTPVDSALPPRKSMLARVSSFPEREQMLNQSSSSPSSLAPGMRRRHSTAEALGQRTNSEGEFTPYVDPRVIEELGEQTAQLLVTTTTRLERARLAVQQDPSPENSKMFQYLISSVVKRNHLQLDDIAIENSRSIADSGEYGITVPTRNAIRAFYEQVEQGLDWLAEAPPIAPISSKHTIEVDEIGESGSTSPTQPTSPESETSVRCLMERINLVRKMKQNMGRTALMLSGGGAQAMYHSGVVRALIEANLYKNIKVVSGTSGGSIIAAMCAIKTPEELLDHICVSNVSTDYMSNGEMKRQNIRWFPKPLEMATYWLKHKLLVDSAEFRRTCEFYYGNITFEEAFERTGKHVCITVSASRANGRTAQRLMLNHISTPHVTIASAVATSCALPGVMAPRKLICKNSSGELENFEVDGVEWIDGSVQADLPFQRISTLFAVTTFIVSQTNFHIVPLLNKEHHPKRNSFYWRLFETMEWDIRSRVLKLSRLGLFPQFFGQDITKVFKQRYHGNLTIVPRFTAMQTLGLKVLANPTVKDMEGYLKYSQIATWPYLGAIRDMIRLERALDDCLFRLEERLRASGGGDPDWSFQDDVDSIASSSAAFATNGSGRVRIIGRPHESSSASTGLLHQMNHLQEENQQLKQQLQLLQKLLEEKGVKEETASETKEEEETPRRYDSLPLTFPSVPKAALGI